MTQADRDRLVALKKAASGAITQRQAAEELKLSERQVRRLLAKLRGGGDQAILHWAAGAAVESKTGRGGRGACRGDLETGCVPGFRAHFSQ